MADGMTILDVAQPRFALGQTVDYRDHHGRYQRGKVLAAEAKWHGWETGPERPYISYTVSHPSYHRRRMYLSEGDLRAT